MLMTVLWYVPIGLALLLVMWPTRSAAQRFLKRWGVPAPDEDRQAQAVRYLRNRRVLYPVLILLIPLADAAWRVGQNFTGAFRQLGPFIVALLLAEAFAALRPPRGPRVATLVTRRWRDLVPRTAVALFLVLAAVAAALAVAALLAQPWAEDNFAAALFDPDWNPSGGYYVEFGQPVGWVVLGGVALGLVAVVGVVALAVRRAPHGDLEVDAALRVRSARVSVGLGVAWMSSMVLTANNRLGFVMGTATLRPGASHWVERLVSLGWLGSVAFIVGLVGWIAVANPPGRARRPEVAG